MWSAVDGVAAQTCPPWKKAWPSTAGHRPKNRQEQTRDVDGDERVLTKSVVTPELIACGQQITLRREEVR